MKSTFIKVIILVIGVCVMAGLGYWVFPTPTSSTIAKPEAPKDSLHYPEGAAQLSYLEIQPVQEFEAPALAALPGKLSFDEDRTVRVNSPVSGRVIELIAQPGSSVKTGDILAWLDSPDFALARADAHKANADATMKRKILERTQALAQRGVLARQDLETAQADSDEAEAEAERAQTVLKHLDPSGDGSRYALRAPIAGIVVDRTINPGMEVRPDASMPLFIITDPSRLWVTFELAEQNLSKVHNDQSARVEVDAFPDEGFPARIIYVGAALDPATRRVTVRATLDNSDVRLKAEMFARITPLDDSGRKQVAVPNSALVSIGLHHYVFVEEAPRTLKRREVQLGVVSDQRAFVTQGLKVAERVVTRGAVLLNSELGEAG